MNSVLEIYSAELHVKKVVEYLEELRDASPGMYAKTRTRLKNISVDLFKGIELISKILQDDSLLDDSEFSSNREALQDLVTELSENSDRTSKQIAELSQFVSTDSVNLTSENKKFLVSYYGRVLSGLASANIPYYKVADCASILWRWYNARFFQSSSGFKYSVSKIPTWISYIVIAYGIALRNKTSQQFLDSFAQWCETTSENNYPLPFAVHSTISSMSADTVTLEALAVWDVLIDYGLAVELPAQLQTFQLGRYMISDIFDKLNLDLTNAYEYYNNDPELLKKYNLIGGEG